ncbi:putative Mg2+ transporter-C (MgtC) family protein [Terribacillus aidingensis]|uniref:Putative Mg2+ transporter-C (MgtC) family protein n=1 Tax=Terribacillus aidingensis TaxID=586416 RepID=A0A285PD28_9BACI|nr:MgtC/SapB family protein [Terribacillus aidingensis]SNZ17761.1 putative Mg2+ transporter-C (MgtC) family protein [Terribacillus aidingensis]
MEHLFSDQSLTVMMKIIIAVFLSGAIGMERGMGNHHAGLRTHILVGVGSCLMMILSLYGFTAFSEEHGYVQFDPARIPSYVISGIGFLGAGTIIVNGSTVKGLTTAASVWTVAGLGLVIGAGMYMEAVFTTVLILLILIFLNNFEKMFLANKKQKAYQLEIELDRDETVTPIMEVLESHHLALADMKMKKQHDGRKMLYVELETRQALNEMKLFEELTNIPNIRTVSTVKS